MVPRTGFEPVTYPLGGDRAIPCATGAMKMIVRDYNFDSTNNHHIPLTAAALAGTFLISAGARVGKVHTPILLAIDSFSISNS